MFWNKKSKEEPAKLPDLPGKKITRLDLPPIDISEPPHIESPELNMRQMPEDFTPRTKIPELPRFKETTSMPKGVREMPINIREEEEIIPPQSRMPSVMEHQESKGPVFVRLDKFKSAKSSLEDIKEKVDEVDELLKKIREIRQKEEQELEYWEKEIHEIQGRLDSVTEGIFEKIE